MPIIYLPQNHSEAHIVCGLLQAHGIAARVEGDLLQGGVGELPVFGLVAVSVEDEDVVEAKQIIATYERGEFVQDE